MNNLCEELHEIIRKGRRFDFSSGYRDLPKNGIYIMFECGEFAHNGDRIVRIGTHTGDKQLPSRIFQHFENENKNRSIFRKNIGRCFLNKAKDIYLQRWELDITTRINKEKYASMIDTEYEKCIERQISKYIQENLSFSIIEVPTKEGRLILESRLIGTVSRCITCFASDAWLGNYSPVEKIQKSGLWQVMELYAQPLIEDELTLIERGLIK